MKQPTLYAISTTLVLLGGCTTTPQGQSLDRSNYADLGTTAVALAADAGAEANPLGVALIPLKVGMGWGMEKYTQSCHKRAMLTKWGNTFYYGAAANNLAVLAGAAVAPAVGLVAAGGYFLARESLEPETFECVPDVPALRLLAAAYTEGDTTTFPLIFTQGATEGSSEGLEAITVGHKAFFAATEDRRMWFLNEEYMSAEVDGGWWHYRYEVEYEDGLISHFGYTEVPLEEVRAL